MPAKRTLKKQELTEDEFYETDAGKHFLRIVTLNMKAYLERDASKEDLLREAAWWKTRCELIELLNSELARRSGNKGGRQNSPKVMRDKAIVEDALRRLVKRGVKVSEDSLHDEAAELVGNERLVAPNSITDCLKKYRASKKSQAWSG